MDQPSALNMRLLAHDDLFGHGNMGEGISLQVAKDGRRVLWMAHECAPKNFTAVDVTDPRKPKPMRRSPRWWMSSRVEASSADRRTVSGRPTDPLVVAVARRSGSKPRATRSLGAASCRCARVVTGMRERSPTPRM